MSRHWSSLTTESWDLSIPDLAGLSPRDIAQVMNDADKSVALAVEAVLDQIGRAITLVAAALGSGGRLFYVGAGTSGRLGILDAAECPPTFSTEPELVQALIAGGPKAVFEAQEGAEDDADRGGRDLENVNARAGDVVVGITASGTTPYVLGALEWARQRCISTVGIACNPGSAIERVSDVAIAVDTGPEVIMGSTRLKAGTAQKMVLNMLSTGAMAALGKTFRNLMVDMRPTNQKLSDRAVRMVSLAVDVDGQTAATLLERAGGETKVAIAMAMLNINAVQARERLQAAHGVLSQLND